MTSVRAIGLTLACTVLVTFSQFFLKRGVTQITGFWSVVNLQIVAGLALTFLGFLLLTVALREGELSVVHPLLGLGFVWVLLASTWLGEPVGTLQYLGVTAILIGVTVISRSRVRA